MLSHMYQSYGVHYTREHFILHPRISLTDFCLLLLQIDLLLDFVKSRLNFLIAFLQAFEDFNFRSIDS